MPEEPNATCLSVFVAATMYRTQAAEAESVTIPSEMFNQLLTIAELSSATERTHLQGQVLTVVMTDGGRHLATLSHPLVGSVSGTGPTMLSAIRAANFQMELAVNGLAG